jgi:hypothetical protein
VCPSGSAARGQQLRALGGTLPGLVGQDSGLGVQDAHGARRFEGGEPRGGGLTGRPARAVREQGLHHGLVEGARLSRVRISGA